LQAINSFRIAVQYRQFYNCELVTLWSCNLLCVSYQWRPEGHANRYAENLKAT